jgi:hypothetical protein
LNQKHPVKIFTLLLLQAFCHSHRKIRALADVAVALPTPNPRGVIAVSSGLDVLVQDTKMA